MKIKRIAQYCCAALVALGIGLNIQNAFADYGINENSYSLVASEETGTEPCSTSSFPLVSSSSYSNITVQTKRVKRCGSFAGWWDVSYFEYEGQELYISITQITHQLWFYTSVFDYEVTLGDGTVVRYYKHYRDCTEYSGEGGSNCDNVGAHESLD